MKKCPKCGFENSDVNAFCSECGTKLVQNTNQNNSYISKANTATVTVPNNKKKIKKIIIVIVVIGLIIFGIYEAYIWIYWGGLDKKSRDTWREFGDSMSQSQELHEKYTTPTLSFDNKELYTYTSSFSDIENYNISLFKIDCEIKEIISNKGKSYECLIEFDNQEIYVDYINPYEEIELNKGDTIAIYGIMRTTNDLYTSDSNIELRKIDASYIEKE